jgi:hypothetical protein
MVTFVIVVFPNLRMSPVVSEKSFDKLSDCETAAHTYLTSTAKCPARRAGNSITFPATAARSSAITV